MVRFIQIFCMEENLEELKKLIVQETGWSLEKLDQKIKEKQDEFAGLITEYGAAYSIARELGILVDKPLDYHKINELENGMSGVNVIARVVRISTPRRFEKNGRTGRVVNLLVRDETGEKKLVLWHKDVDLVERGIISKNSILCIKNAYVKDNEIHVGMFGTVEVLEEDHGIPEVEEHITHIYEITGPMDEINTFGRVVRVFPMKEFERENRTVRVRSAILFDGKEIRLVLWDSNADVSLVPGEIVKIEGGYVVDNNGVLEIHVGSFGRVVVGVEPPFEISSPYTRVRISDIKEDGEYEIRATVVKQYPSNTIRICPKCRELVEDTCSRCDVPGVERRIINMELDDGTGVVRGTLFTDEDVVLEGKEFLFFGRVKYNSQFDRWEMSIRGYSRPNFGEEINYLLTEHG